MAGFFGLFNYAKEGPGVEPDEPEKGPVAEFFSILGSKFWKLIIVNLMMILFNIVGLAAAFFFSGWVVQLFLPGFTFNRMLSFVEVLGIEFAEGVTAADYASHLFTGNSLTFLFTFVGFQYFVLGPVYAGITLILRNFSRRTPVFMWMDFKETALKNWKQSLIHSVISTLLLVLLGIAFYFYGSAFGGTILPMVLRIFLIMVLIIYTMMQFYIYQLIITFDLSLKDIYKNALLFTFLRLPSNFGVFLLCLIFLLVIPFLIIWTVPNAISLMIIFLLYTLLFLSFTLFLINFQANRGIYKYMIKPIEEKEAQEESVRYSSSAPEIPEEVEEEEESEEEGGEIPTGAPA